MTGVSQQKAGRPQSVLFHFRSSYNCCYASGLVVWASVINSGWKPHHLLAGKSIQPVGVDFFSTSGKFISSGWSGEGFLTVFLSARVCFFIEWFCFLVSANGGPYHLLRVCQFFNIFTFPLFFRQGGLFIFHLVQCMTDEMTIEDAHKLISEDYFFTGLIIVIGES